MDVWDAIGDFLEESGRPEMADRVRNDVIVLGTRGLVSVTINEPWDRTPGFLLLVSYANGVSVQLCLRGYERRKRLARFLLEIPHKRLAIISCSVSKVRSWETVSAVGFFGTRYESLDLPPMPRRFSILSRNEGHDKIS